MTAVTVNLPDQLARYTTEQDTARPGWLETLVRKAKRAAKLAVTPHSANNAAWKKILAEYEKMPPLPGDDLPPRINLTRDLPL